MAPEQIEGHEADARSDLFSFGAVLFEMLTGRRAFDGDSAHSVRAAILEHEPPPVSSLQPLVPPAVDDIVRRCLAKNPDERWQTAGDVIRELKRALESIVQARHGAAAGRGPQARQVVEMGWPASVAAVLRACRMGHGGWLAALVARGQLPARFDPSPSCRSRICPATPEQEYFADGMTEQLIADLATIGGLRVISRDVGHALQKRHGSRCQP